MAQAGRVAAGRCGVSVCGAQWTCEREVTRGVCVCVARTRTHTGGLQGRAVRVSRNKSQFVCEGTNTRCSFVGTAVRPQPSRPRFPPIPARLHPRDTTMQATIRTAAARAAGRAAAVGAAAAPTTAHARAEVAHPPSEAGGSRPGLNCDNVSMVFLVGRGRLGQGIEGGWEARSNEGARCPDPQPHPPTQPAPPDVDARTADEWAAISRDDVDAVVQAVTARLAPRAVAPTPLAVTGRYGSLDADADTATDEDGWALAPAARERPGRPARRFQRDADDAVDGPRRAGGVRGRPRARPQLPRHRGRGGGGGGPGAGRPAAPRGALLLPLRLETGATHSPTSPTPSPPLSKPFPTASPATAEPRLSWWPTWGARSRGWRTGRCARRACRASLVRRAALPIEWSTTSTGAT